MKSSCKQQIVAAPFSQELLSKTLKICQNLIESKTNEPAKDYNSVKEIVQKISLERLHQKKTLFQRISMKHLSVPDFQKQQAFMRDIGKFRCFQSYKLQNSDQTSHYRQFFFLKYYNTELQEIQKPQTTTLLIKSKKIVKKTQKSGKKMSNRQDNSDTREPMQISEMKNIEGKSNEIIQSD